MSDFCWLWEDSCRFVIDAAWVQALLSVLAIWWAGKTASSQAKAQHETAMKQVKAQHDLDLAAEERQHSERVQMIVNALSERVRHTRGVLNTILGEIDQAVLEQRRFTDHREVLFQDMLRDIERDLAGLSIFDLPNAKLVNEFVVLRTAVKQVIFNFQALMRRRGFFDGQLKNDFFPSAQQALSFLNDFDQKLLEAMK